MDDTKRMLQAIINGQSAMKSELPAKIGGIDKKVDQVRKDLRSVEANLIKRIDKIGLQVARLEEDTPTRDEHEDLIKRLEKFEHISASA